MIGFACVLAVADETTRTVTTGRWWLRDAGGSVYKSTSTSLLSHATTDKQHVEVHPRPRRRRISLRRSSNNRSNLRHRRKKTAGNADSNNNHHHTLKRSVTDNTTSTCCDPTRRSRSPGCPSSRPQRRLPVWLPRTCSRSPSSTIPHIVLRPRAKESTLGSRAHHARIPSASERRS